MQRTILVVEDKEPSRALITAALTRQGYQVFEARDATEAVDQWTEPGRVFDLLLSDVRLGEEDNGFALAEKLLSLRPGIPVIFISGDKDCFASPSIGIFGDAPFIAKPFDLKKMLSAVEQVLAQSGKTSS